MLSISIDLPFIAYTLDSVSIHHVKMMKEAYVSPGLLAVGPGRFSVSGVRTTRLILAAGPSLATSTRSK